MGHLTTRLGKLGLEASSTTLGLGMRVGVLLLRASECQFRASQPGGGALGPRSGLGQPTVGRGQLRAQLVGQTLGMGRTRVGCGEALRVPGRLRLTPHGFVHLGLHGAVGLLQSVHLLEQPLRPT